MDLQEVIKIVKGIAGNDYLYFDTSVTVKLSPHQQPFNSWAVCVSPSNDLYVMDADETWHQLIENDSLVIVSLYQRLKSMSALMGAA